LIWLVVALLLAWVALGPWVLVAVGLALLVPRVRWWVQDRVWVTRRALATTAAAALAVVGLVVVIPDGWLPIPQSPGLMVAPKYRGRPIAAHPVAAQPPPQHPHLARNGAGTGGGDAWATGAYGWAGPVGLQPDVDTAWYGGDRCPALTFDSRDRIVALCGDADAPELRVLDPESMRPLAAKGLRVPEDGVPDDCAAPPVYLDNADRAVVATPDGRVLAVRTSDADGEPDLTTEQAWDLGGSVPEDECVVGLLPDWAGRIWFATGSGVVGTVDPATGKVRTHDLGEDVVSTLAADETGGVFVVSDTAAYRMAAGPEGGPVVTWRSTYDRGTERKTGQPAQGSGTPPTLLDNGLMAIADNAEPRMQVVFLERSTGREVCRQAVFEEDESATGSSLTSVGTGVVVENNHGYAGPLRTLLGRGTSAGLARVDVAGGRCRLAWTSDEMAPSSVPKASWATGLLYAYTKRPTWWGVSAWYLTALDLSSGHTVFSVRTGTGVLMNSDHAAVTIGPDGTAYVATLAGLVRVRDRR
jgi:hypothetical protein